VAYHLVVDHARRQPRADLSLEESLIAADADPGDGADEREAQARARARAALWQLTAEQQQVIILKYFEGLSNGEVATALDKPVGAVKSLQSRALAALRRMLSQESEGVSP
jgi:RNA polymerase sigma-70 factor (ECF subfamily)